MRKFLGGLLLSGIIAMPVVMVPTIARADDHPQRYYDADRKDYHEWNENEDRAWRGYLKERRREYREFGKASKREQREYWRWRHDHPDSTH